MSILSCSFTNHHTFTYIFVKNPKTKKKHGIVRRKAAECDGRGAVGWGGVQLGWVAVLRATRRIRTRLSLLRSRLPPSKARRGAGRVGGEWGGWGRGWGRGASCPTRMRAHRLLLGLRGGPAAGLSFPPPPPAGGPVDTGGRCPPGQSPPLL